MCSIKKFLIKGNFLFISLLLLSILSCKKDTVIPDPLSGANYRQLDTEMHHLWADHMQYTYLTVDAFFHNPTAVNAQLARLLRNQEEIGAAIVPYYGQTAGDQLATLLKAHINEAVPVLTAAQSGDQPALNTAINNWRNNGREIADFLSGANPANWEQNHMRSHMDDHLTKTISYAVDLLQNDYATASADYDAAFMDMMHLAEQLAEGIAKQFPEKF